MGGNGPEYLVFNSKLDIRFTLFSVTSYTNAFLRLNMRLLRNPFFIIIIENRQRCTCSATGLMLLLTGFVSTLSDEEFVELVSISKWLLIGLMKTV